jgi:3-dehydroquinate synthase
VLAIGGGVTGDLAGFVAATYMRGIPVVQVPTSLLAMVDSSVGGKTGVDTEAGKNLVGAFHAPALVVVDPELLATLPPRQVRAGLAEAVKHGAIMEADYFREIEQGADDLVRGDVAAMARLVERSVRIKASVVTRDPAESGIRRILNFGHTLGHAIEQVSGYTVLHGEAIAIGMVLEARIGEDLNTTGRGAGERLAGLLGRLGLPVELPDGMDADSVLAATRLDKKSRSGAVEYALIAGIGRAAEACVVPDDVARRVLAAPVRV